MTEETKTEAALFIGGTWDGRRIHVEVDRNEIDVPQRETLIEQRMAMPPQHLPSRFERYTRVSVDLGLPFPTPVFSREPINSARKLVAVLLDGYRGQGDE